MRDLSEFNSYVADAETRLAASSDPVSSCLRSTYEALKARFSNDLCDSRDEIVSRAAALMFAEAMLRSESAGGSGSLDLGSSMSIDEAALAAAYVSLHDGARIWKNIDFSITERWYELGWIGNPRGNAKSIVLTPLGLERAKAAYVRLTAGASK
jgi:hypothetical protein